jgi:hypothetical protein
MLTLTIEKQDLWLKDLFDFCEFSNKPCKIKITENQKKSLLKDPEFLLLYRADILNNVIKIFNIELHCIN